MELTEVIYFVIGLAILTLIVNYLKMRPAQHLGYLFTYTNEHFSYKSGVLNMDGTKTFSIVVENQSNQNLKVNEMFIEIKEGSRYKKYSFPSDVSDPSGAMIIPPMKKGAVFMELRDFRKFLKKEADFRTVVSIEGHKILKSLPLRMTGKNREIQLKK